jgi:glycosyltransferase involved in cell wall biosynthesis
MIAMTINYRVLHLVSNSRWTGVAEPAASVARYQQAAGWPVWVACIWGRSMEEQLRARQLPLAAEVEIPRRINPFATLKDVRRLRRFIQENKIEVVHCHQLHEHWLAALALRGWKGDAPRPLLVRTVHRYEPMRRDPWHSWLFARATDLIITVSTEQAQLIRDAYPQGRGLVETIFGGVNPARFAFSRAGRRQVRADMGESDDAVVGGIVAHLGYNRGHRWLLSAAEGALRAAPRGAIWIVGKGEMKRELRAACLEPRFDGRLVMAGYRSDDLPETYAAMDFSMLLGLGSEGSARAALEAMACGRPVIGIRRGAMVDTIEDSVDGFLLDENDVAGLEDRLVRLLNSPQLCEQMGAAAREKVLRLFTEERRFERTVEAYARAAARLAANHR